ncbi:MAG: hypothetical protein OIN90_18085 [Candidatus Methanoperedens sp.]|nr:hypothetical protein [Candidatus Methanoperedens sp. BLZ2]MBZ0176059.1 hypothetical protein [Candidatus Methanoperedens nitroreducens]MCX9089462.1 hypothetical protein [Candidatus Methanoperedens sp.]
MITDALCPFCGCLCDDITIVVEDNNPGETAANDVLYLNEVEILNY